MQAQLIKLSWAFCIHKFKGDVPMWIINYEYKPSGLSGTPRETKRETYNTKKEFRKALGELLINANNRDVFRLRYHYETEEVVIGET